MIIIYASKKIQLSIYYENQITFYAKSLSATCFPTAPITPPPGWAELPQIHTPPTSPLNRFVNIFYIPILP